MLERRITYEQQERELNDALKGLGIQNTIAELRDPELYTNSAEVLLELFNKPFCDDILREIAGVLFLRPLTDDQRQRAVERCLDICRRGMEGVYSGAELIAGNELADNVGPRHVAEIGRMFLENSRGERRGVFARALGRVADENAISFLRAGANDPETANWAITELARLIQPREVIEICNTVLTLPNLLYEKHIKQVRAKLQRKLAKWQPLHLTDDSPADNLEEWSANIDGNQAPQILRVIWKAVDSGFGRVESAEVRSVMDGMNPDETMSFRFDAKIDGEVLPLWIQVYCDDGDAFDFSIFAPADFIRQIDSEITLE